jgi:hypothetical protein
LVNNNLFLYICPNKKHEKYHNYREPYRPRGA